MTEPILLVTEYFPPAVGGSAELLASIYGRLGAGVHVLTTAATGVSPTAASGAPISRIPFPHALGLIAPRSLKDVVGLARHVHRLSGTSTVVHCGRALPEGTAAWLDWLVTRRPYVCWTHGEELPIAAGSRELTWLQRRVHLAAAALLANSHSTARLLAALGNAPEKVHVIYPGVDAQRFRPEVDGAADLRRSLARDDEILMLTVGRLQARKGHDLVLKALGSLPAGSPVVRYAVVGDGPDGPRLKALAADLGLLSRVHFVGVVPPEALPAYYAAADIFIHPNRVEGEDFEGFGIVFLEAAAAGLPAIGGRSGGAPEAIEEGRTGELVSGTDTEELRASIVRIAASRSARTTLGKAARERVLAQFTWERAADELREIDGNVRRRGKMNSR